MKANSRSVDVFHGIGILCLLLACFARISTSFRVRPYLNDTTVNLPPANVLVAAEENVALKKGMPVLVLKPQSVSIKLGDSAQIVVQLENGPISRDTTITWTYDGNQQVLSSKLPPLTIPAGVKNYSKSFTVSSNGQAGRCTIIAHNNNNAANSSEAVLSVENAFTTVTVYHADWINVVSSIVGWIYFASWTLSFYPQMWVNYTRRSVVGLSFDFLALNTIGFSCYSAFNAALFWAPVPRAEYHSWHPYNQIQVEPNDVAFCFHAVIITLVTIGQCFRYERGGQTVSWPTWVFIAGALIAAIVQAVLCGTGHEQWLNLLYYLSYVKLAVSCIKYFPQMYKNFRLKSTAGWSIGNVLLDLNGGAFSLLQMFMQAYNQDDWASVFYNPTKFGMGALSIFFDVIFMVQHYILYNPRRLARRRMRPANVSTYGSYDDFNGTGPRAASPTSLLPHNSVHPSSPSSPLRRHDAVAPAATILQDDFNV